MDAYREVVINKCYGGFGISSKAMLMLEELKETKVNQRDIERDDKDLIKVIKTLGEEAEGDFARLKIITIPADIEWIIQEYDGIEWIAEKHRTWG